MTVIKNGQYEPVSLEDWEAFKAENPDLIKYLEDPEPEVLNDLPIPDVSD